MINLLPLQEKKALALNNIQKRVLFLLFIISVAFLFLILILFCLKTYLISETNSLEVLVRAKEKEFQGAHIQNFKKIIAQANQDLVQIQGVWKKQILFTSVFETLKSLTPDAIYFTDLIFSENTINIAGLSKTREDLLIFKQNLESEGLFTDVYFLPFSWTKPTDVSFSLSLNLSL